MNHEKLFKTDSGLQIKISVSFSSEPFFNCHRWDVNITCKPPRYKKWTECINDEQGLPARESYSLQILDTKLELWELLNPKL